MPNKIKCMVVDDEEAAHYVLIDYINYVDRLEVEAQCYNALEAINYLHLHKIDLIFLDINMPGLSGFDFLKTLTKPPAIIFTTAYQQYALEGYNYGIVDYLTKPIEFSRFLKGVDRYLFLYADRTPGDSPGPVANTVDLKVDSEIVTIKVDDIIYTQSLGNYVKVFTANRVYVCSVTTTELEKRLPAEKFTRIHKSHLVAIKRVEELLPASLMIDGKELPVGITYKRNLADKFK
ncbi:MAG TPA: LytTR family DNA-binding domain-containing protein [Chitinophagaceae bacterium]|nr:LytTR family DNA-binding domain-containing protein [Chitinophagaceae bacterium]